MNAHFMNTTATAVMVKNCEVSIHLWITHNNMHTCRRGITTISGLFFPTYLLQRKAAGRDSNFRIYESKYFFYWESFLNNRARNYFFIESIFIVTLILKFSHNTFTLSLHCKWKKKKFPSFFLLLPDMYVYSRGYSIQPEWKSYFFSMLITATVSAISSTFFFLLFFHSSTFSLLFQIAYTVLLPHYSYSYDFDIVSHINFEIPSETVTEYTQ